MNRKYKHTYFNLELINRTIFLLAMVCLLFCQGCDSSSSESDDGGGGPLLPPVEVQEISIVMDPADWDQIRNTARDPEILINECGEAAEESPYEHVPATVTVDGETLTNVGVRTKGWWGSINPSRPSLKIEFDEFEPGQLYHGIEKMTLNNNDKDLSRMNTCLALQTFRRAGYPAPQCGYAHVTVNGKDLGIYSSVEPIKDPFLEKWFDSDAGNLYESQLADFVPNAINRWERKNNDSTAGDRSDIEAIMTALEADNDTLLDELDPLIDLDRFYTYWALEVLISFWDGYNGNRNNCYLYNDPDTGKFVFIPWGPDNAFQAKASILPVNSVGPLFANAMLSKRLYDHPVARADFIAEVTRLYDIVWGSNRLEQEARHTQEALRPYIVEEFNPDYNAAVNDLVQFMSSHPQSVYSTLIAPASPPDYPYESVYNCYSDISPVYPFHIEFSTTWGPSVFNNGTISVFDMHNIQPVSDPALMPFYSVTAYNTVAGDMGGLGNVKLSFFEAFYVPAPAPVYFTTRGDMGGIVLTVSKDRFLAGGTIEIENLTTCGMLIYLSDFNNPGNAVFWGLVIDGTLTITESGMEDGDPVSGTFDGDAIFWLELAE